MGLIMRRIFGRFQKSVGIRMKISRDVVNVKMELRVHNVLFDVSILLIAIIEVTK